MLIDTHCHLDDHHSGAEAQELLSRARSAGVGAFIVIGVGSDAARADALRLSREQPDVVATLGVHPHDAAESSPALEQELEAQAASHEVVAIGEVGLDFHYDHSPRDVQDQVFRRFVQLARRVKKPLIIHTRTAAEETLRVLEEEDAREVGGVIHCFSEDIAFARRALDLGFDLSFSGILTFKSATAIQEVAAWAPPDRILVETDSPYLAPVPLRGKRCEPAFVVHTARRLAELRGQPLEVVSQLTTENACRRFGPALSAALAAQPS